MKKTTLILIPILVLLFVPAIVLAYAAETGNIVKVEADKVIDGNFYAAGNAVTIDGTVNGDLFVAGQNITVNGKVAGDIFAAGQNITVNGPVGSSLRAAGANITVNGRVEQSVAAFGANFSLGPDASVGWDLLFAGATGNILGKVGYDLHGGGAAMTIAGEVGRDVKLRLGDSASSEGSGYRGAGTLILEDSARIGGNLFYTAPEEGEIAEGARIGGEVGYSRPEYRDPPDFERLAMWGWIYSIFSALVIGLVIISLWREPVKKITDKMLAKPVHAFGWGALITVVTPFIVLLLLLTLIGLPLALIILVLWLIAMYVSKVIVGILVGRSLLNRLAKEKKDSLIWAMILGVTIVLFITGLPIIGWLLCLLTIWWALGGLWLYFRKYD